MGTDCFRGIIRGGLVVLTEPSSTLAEGTEVLITPLENAPGTSKAVLAAMENSPCVPSAWVDELELLIAQGKVAAAQHDPFAEEK